MSYTPFNVGDHEIDLRYDGEPLPDSPYPVTVKSGCNPDKVKAHGDGLERGIVDEHNQFVIETRNAGTGGLGLAMEGPNEAVVQVRSLLILFDLITMTKICLTRLFLDNSTK